MKYDEIVLEPGMYKSCIPLHDILEDMDPDMEYVGTALRDLDAYGRQLRRYDIKVSGDRCDTVEKFYQNNSSACLFPEYIISVIHEGYTDRISEIYKCIGVPTKLDSLDYRSISFESKSNLCASTNENLTKLSKISNVINISYESIRFQRISVVKKYFYTVGQYLASRVIRRLFGTIFNAVGINTSDKYCEKIPSISLDYMNADLVIASTPDTANICRDMYKVVYEPILKEYNVNFIIMNSEVAIEEVLTNINMYDFAVKVIGKQLDNLEISFHVGFNVLCKDAIKAIGR